MTRETVITISGNVVNEPILREFDSGSMVVNFRIASNSRRYDTHVKDWVDGSNLFLSVSCWGQLALRAYKALIKGKAVIVTGSLRTVDFVGTDGMRRSTFELKASDIGLSLSRQLVQYCPLPHENNSSQESMVEENYEDVFCDHDHESNDTHDPKYVVMATQSLTDSCNSQAAM